MSATQTSDVVNIVLTGVGGQGSVKAGQILARAAVLHGLSVTTSEVHGMAQRGGSVFSTVRLGREVYSPVVPEGEAQYLVAFERLEALRYLPYMRQGGVALVNEQRITPTIESLKHAPYPAEVDRLLARRAGRTLMVPGLEVARRLGNVRLANSVLLGALSTFLDLPAPHWRQALTELVPSPTLELNKRAFEEGAVHAREHQPAV
jgi:indolepyruvate ferredoxin oxidoreductase beta subunit